MEDIYDFLNMRGVDDVTLQKMKDEKVWCSDMLYALTFQFQKGR